MSPYRNLGDLFEEEPEQFGLRGDTYLWQEMRTHFSKAPLPATASDLEQTIEQAFLLLAGQPMSGTENFRVKRFAHGGISSGRISRTFWRKRALPLLKGRWIQADASASTKKFVDEDQTSRMVVVSIATRD
jgi:hypothetical protein